VDPVTTRVHVQYRGRLSARGSCWGFIRLDYANRPGAFALLCREAESHRSRGRVVHPEDSGALLMQTVEDVAGVLGSWLYYWVSTSLRVVGALPRNTSSPVQSRAKQRVGRQ